MERLVIKHADADTCLNLGGLMGDDVRFVACG